MQRSSKAWHVARGSEISLSKAWNAAEISDLE